MKEINVKFNNQKNYHLEESYKKLRINIQLSGAENKVIMFTNCNPNAVKKSVSLNLARSIAESGKKVLFIDADLRKSVLVGRNKIKGKINGLSDYLVGLSRLEDVIYMTNIDRLSMVFSGEVPPNPAELLDGKLFRTLIPRLKEVYDYVIIDTPPLGNVIDAAIVAESVDAAVLVIGSGDVSRKYAQMILEQFRKTDCKILGVVLDKVDMRANGYYGRYYGKKYGNDEGKSEN